MTDKYKNNGSPCRGVCKIGGFERVYLIVVNACSHSSVHWKAFFVFKVWKKHEDLDARQGKNLESAASLPVNRWTSLRVRGLVMSKIARHFSGFASIPRLVSMKSRNLPL